MPACAGSYNDREPTRSEPPATGFSPVAGVATVLKTPMVSILIAVFIGANFAASIVLTWMPSFLNRKFGMSLARLTEFRN